MQPLIKVFLMLVKAILMCPFDSNRRCTVGHGQSLADHQLTRIVTTWKTGVCSVTHSREKCNGSTYIWHAR